MKKKLLSLFMASMIIITTVACEKEVIVENERPDVAEVEPVSEGVTVIDHPLEATIDGEVMSEGHYPEILLCEEYKKQYPKLNRTINDYNTYWSDGMKANVEAYARMRKSDREEGIEEGSYSYQSDMELVRFDSRIFTVVYTNMTL